ncbi:dihydrodipicolinate synthase family protein [Caballeronia sp. GAWG1-1]|uniref:dihydrodipicolinate synthase family protein n=1 Tax=Caballeronia sp. GAWG1-1 TaxID=2921742 RepID=UPI0020285625|nr:dihydrodipicolinate synthase family protein [Caballeronia sp. GAWG1-1]
MTYADAASTPAMTGVLAPALTPFDTAGDIDQPAFESHCRWLLDAGVGLAVFGTNSEAASLSFGERLHALEALITAGLDPARFMPGTGTCSVRETVDLTRQALGLGIHRVLMLPPFYFPQPSEAGLLRYYLDVIEQVADARLRLYLYHIPQMTGVPITLSLIEQLRSRYPSIVCGIKDSSGDWANLEATLKTFAADGFSVFPASEALLSRALPLGAAGCISATANMNPAGLVRYFAALSANAPAPDEQMALAVRSVFASMPMIPAMKSVLARSGATPDWAHVRAPLTALDQRQGDALMQSLDDIGFRLEGLTVNA